MGTGLTFEGYIELTAMPMAGADPVFVQAVKEERDGMFPMKLVVAANHLRSRYYGQMFVMRRVPPRGVTGTTAASTSGQSSIDSRCATTFESGSNAATRSK